MTVATQQRASKQDGPGKKTTTFRPDIEGLRGIAVFIVVAFHCGVPGFHGGFVGVDVFFVLSGYLITGLLLAELDTSGRIDFLGFYARRARRLLPASVLVAFSTMCFAWVFLSPAEIAETARAARASALYLSNVFFAINAADYFTADVQNNPLLHTWSLSVEEQFYFVWPLLLVVFAGLLRSRRQLIAALTVVAIVSLTICVATTGTRPTFAFYQLPARAWEFAVGGLASQMSISKLSPRPSMLKGARALGLGLIAAAVYFTHEGPGFPGWKALLPVVGTSLALVASGALLNANWMGWLETRPMQWLGRHSYGWYLWHWPLLIAAGVFYPSRPLVATVTAGVLALVVATTSLQWVENPLRYSSYLASKPMRSLALAAILAVVGLGVSQAGLAHATALAKDPRFAAITLAVDSGMPGLSRAQCLSGAEDDRVRPCVFGSRDTTAPHVVLWGDSHAMHLFDPLLLFANERSWRFTTVLKSGCPATGITLRGKAAAQVAACNRWRSKAITDIQRMAPEIIIVSNAIGYLDASGRPASGLGTTTAEWEQGVASTMNALAGRSKVLWLRDVPLPPFNVPRCLARALRMEIAWLQRSCDVQRSQALPDEIYAAESRAANLLPSVTLVDLSNAFCSSSLCSVVIDGTLVYRDDNHLNARFAEKLKEDIQRAIVEAK